MHAVLRAMRHQTKTSSLDDVQDQQETIAAQ